MATQKRILFVQKDKPTVILTNKQYLNETGFAQLCVHLKQHMWATTMLPTMWDSTKLQQVSHLWLLALLTLRLPCDGGGGMPAFDL